MEGLPEGKKIILFDGVCNLCDNLVQFLIKKDRKDSFRFVSLQSDLGEKILTHIGIDPKKTDSIILYEPGVAYYYKAEAVFMISREIGGLWGWLWIFSWLPKFISFPIYDYVAKNRYKWYGKKESCMIPSPEIQEKFLQ